jgi:hypothetical protein
MGRLAAVGFVLVVGAVTTITRSVNYVEAKATVDTIDRKCNFIETTTEADGRSTARGVTEHCDATDEFRKLAKEEKRSRSIAGKAVVHVSYSSPADGSWQTADLHFDGGDDQFYKLKAGDEVNILVHKDDPKKIMID